MDLHRQPRVSVSRLRRLRFACFTTVAIIALVASSCASSASIPAGPTAGQPSGTLGAASGTAGASAAGNSGAGGVHNLCSLLTENEVAAALGTSVAAGNELNDGHLCSWANDTAGVDASVADGTGGADYDGICTVSDVSIAKVDGVGDAACYLVAGNLATSLQFKKNGQSYAIAVTLPNGTVQAVETAEKALAVEAAGRI